MHILAGLSPATGGGSLKSSDKPSRRKVSSPPEWHKAQEGEALKKPPARAQSANERRECATCCERALAPPALPVRQAELPSLSLSSILQPTSGGTAGAREREREALWLAGRARAFLRSSLPPSLPPSKTELCQWGTGAVGRQLARLVGLVGFGCGGREGGGDARRWFGFRLEPRGNVGASAGLPRPPRRHRRTQTRTGGRGRPILQMPIQTKGKFSLAATDR